MTRPIARDSRMAERRTARVVYGLAAGAIGLALVAALVVLPIRRWWDQRADLADRRSELDILERANSDLANDVAALNTPEGIAAAARDELNYAYPGEDRTRPAGDVVAPQALPAGSPYDVVRNILQSRTNLAAASPNPGPDPAATSPVDPAAADTTAPAATDAPEPTIAPPAGNPVVPG